MPGPARVATPHRLPMRAGAAAALLATTALLVALAGCGTAPSVAPSVSAPASSNGASAAPTEVPTPAGSRPGASATAEPGQTDTDWGRIWDAVPASFPRPPGATPSEPVGREPSSAEYAVGTSPVDVTDFYRRSLEAAGFVADATGPFEDGSRVVEAVAGDVDCRIRVTVAPLGGTTHVTILFAAACPYR